MLHRRRTCANVSATEYIKNTVCANHMKREPPTTTQIPKNFGGEGGLAIGGGTLEIKVNPNTSPPK